MKLTVSEQLKQFTRVLQRVLFPTPLMAITKT
jgi:hypothetical protein